MLGLIKTDMKNLADIAPLVDDDIIEQFRRHYTTDGHHYPTHTANITNGLTPIVINNHGDPPVSPPPVSPMPSGDIVVVEIPENPPAVSGGDGAMC